MLYRYGEGTSNPTETQLKDALFQLYHENIPGMTEGDYADHGAATILSTLDLARGRKD